MNLLELWSIAHQYERPATASFTVSFVRRYECVDVLLCGDPANIEEVLLRQVKIGGSVRVPNLDAAVVEKSVVDNILETCYPGRRKTELLQVSLMRFAAGDCPIE